jgi:predicted enzyme related to lactoylglutathione lyase
MTKHMGRVIWRETMTKDVAKAKAFYGGLFGWSFKDMDMGPGGIYPIIENGGVGIGGMMALTPEMAKVPAHWTSYVAVKDVDAAVATATQHGGGKTWGPMDVPNVGRMGGVHGFDGAALSIMKPEGPDQERPARPPVGSFCWETLTTADVDRAKTFWSAVCGWQTFAGGGMPTFGVAAGMENQVADIQPAQGPVPPNWLTYVVVEKIEPSCEKAAKLGGKVMMPAMPVPGIGRIAVIVDDQGAALGLFEPAMG